MGKTIKLNDDTYIANDIYSTEERIIGTWIDGKTLYRKTIDYGYVPNSTYRMLNTGVQNIDKVVNIYGIGINESYNTPLPNPHFDTGNIISLGYYVPSNSVFLNNNSGNNVSYYCYITIEYTKTTD